MSKKQPPVAPPTPAFDPANADFPALLERFHTSGCDNESYVLATHMMRFPKEALALLPTGIDQKLDFNGDSQTTSHEWASALLAAKKLKIETGLELAVEKVDQLVDKAKDIYKATHPEIKANNPATNSCRIL